MAENLIYSESELAFFLNADPLCFLYSIAPPPFALAAGENYRVVWDGAPWDVTVIDTSTLIAGSAAMGNGTAFGFPGNGEPFIVLYSGLDVAFISTVDTTPQTHSVEIYKVVEEEEETPDKEYLIWGSTLRAIGNAIREKTGSTEDISPVDMPVAIAGITGGGGGNAEDVRYVTFMSHDGATELYKRSVLSGNDCMEIVSGGLIDAPTKESTNTENFTFAGWATEVNGGLNANALKNVTEDRTVYANYIATTRYYTVRFYDGETLLKTMQVEYGASAIYTPEKEGYQFEGWQPVSTNITADTDCYAQWATAITFANATWAQIAEISTAGTAANYFKVGDTRQIPYGSDYITVVIAGFNHDDLADGSGKAGISIVCRTVPTLKSKWNSSYNSSMSYPYSNAHSTSSYVRNSLPRTNLEGTVLGNLPADLRAVIKPVTKNYDKSQAKGTASLASCTDSLWLLSLDELGHNWGSNFTTSNISALGSKYELFKSMDYTASSTTDKQAVATVGTTTTKAHYWTRSINRTGSTMDYWSPFYVTTDGIAKSVSFQSGNYNGAPAKDFETYLCFGFCI